MLNIVICEDNDKQRKQIEDTARDYIVDNSFEISIAISVADPYKVINYLENNKNNSSIYFLDISLQSDINGLALAKTIRKMDPEGYIIFVTTHSELTLLTFEYKIEAMDYIIKDEIDKIKGRINECIAEAYRSYSNKKIKDDATISINSGNRIINVKINDILFFETSDKIHKVKVHTCNRQIEFYGTLKDVENLVNNDFYRSHKSYLVNVKRIREIDRENMVAIMINDEKCYISNRYIKGLLKR